MYKISFSDTAIKKDMTTGFASLLNVCPSVKSLKYVYIFLVIAMLISSFCVFFIQYLKVCLAG